jgi:enamine deaminase RidA (YjgF/YER057c/UK114 family)
MKGRIDMDIDAKLKQMGLALPAAPKPVAAYIPAVRTGNLLQISGQLPMREGKMLAAGKVPTQVDIPNAQQAARQCMLNALAVVHDALAGDWSKFVRIVRLGVFVQCDDTFTDQPKVANGASEFLVELLGDPGRHARAAVGVNALPLGAAVEIEMTVEVR